MKPVQSSWHLHLGDVTAVSSAVLHSASFRAFRHRTVFPSCLSPLPHPTPCPPLLLRTSSAPALDSVSILVYLSLHLLSARCLHPGVPASFTTLASPQLRDQLAKLTPAATGITAGAFGAHALKTRFPNLPETSHNSWMTGSNYLIYNGIALIALSAHPSVALGIKKYKTAAGLIVGGVMVFSGSIFALVLARDKVSKVAGPITPLGGLAMIAG